MPNIIPGSLWNYPTEVIIIPACSEITGRRGLDLSTRFAKQARRISGLKLRQYAARALSSHPTPDEYGFLLLPAPADNFGLFQIKRLRNDPADLNLIRNSVKQLTRFAQQHPNTIMGMPFPTTAQRKDIDPALVHAELAKLPSNVQVFIEHPRLLPQQND